MMLQLRVRDHAEIAGGSSGGASSSTRFGACGALHHGSLRHDGNRSENNNESTTENRLTGCCTGDARSATRCVVCVGTMCHTIVSALMCIATVCGGRGVEAQRGKCHTNNSGQQLAAHSVTSDSPTVCVNSLCV